MNRTSGRNAGRTAGRRSGERGRRFAVRHLPSALLLLGFAATGASRTGLAQPGLEGLLDLPARVQLQALAGRGPAPGLPAGSESSGDTLRGWILHTERNWRCPAEFRGRLRFHDGADWVLRLGPGELSALVGRGGVLGICAERRLRPCLDIARQLTGADLVHDPPPEQPAWRGRGVLVGVVDTGIDPAHPDFWEDGQLRVRACWDQESDRVWSRDVLAQGLAGNLDQDGHGSHVCGIAAGNGASHPGETDDGPFVGFAPEAELLVVRSTLYESDVLSGAEWIFQHAEELGRPCVVNLSLETHLGAHDGSSFLERELSELSGPGRLVVCAAGNSGDAGQHASALFGFSHLLMFRNTHNRDLSCDCWIESGEEPQVLLTLPGGSEVEPRSQGIYQDGWHLQLPPPQQEGGKWRLLLQVESGPDLEGDWELRFDFQGAGTRQLHAWGFNLVFENPDSLSTLGIPATGDSMLVAGSLVSRLSWTDMDGSSWYYPGETEGSPSSFSGRGPRVDGRLVPQVLMPGQGIFSVMSSALEDDPGQRQWRHADGWHILRQGTSMAAPGLSGLLALALQKNPLLGASQADSLLRAAAGPQWTTAAGHGLPQADALLESIPGGPGEILLEADLDWIRIRWTLAEDLAGGSQRLTREVEDLADEFLADLPAAAGDQVFLDPDPPAALPLRYRVDLLDASGLTSMSRNSAWITLPEARVLKLLACYPNPLDSGPLRCEFVLEHGAQIGWRLYDILGRLCAKGEFAPLDRGWYHESLALPGNLGSGIYVLQLHGPDLSAARRVVLME